MPIFAFFAAGVSLGGWQGISAAAANPVTLAIIAALVLGKPIGIVATTWVTTRLLGTRLDPSYRWIDLSCVGLLAGIGFPVSLLVAELSFAAGSPEHDYAKVAVLAASVIAALAASAVLGVRNMQYARINRRLSQSISSAETPDPQE